MRERERTELIIITSWVGIAANAILALLKIVIGLLTASLAVVSDGVDSSVDILSSVITLFTAHILRKPPDVRFPYGYARAETLATKVLSFIIFFSGAQLLIQSVRTLIRHEEVAIPGNAAIYITLVSIIVKLILAFYKMRVGKQISSSMLIADAKNMRNDVVISLFVLIGVGLTKLLGFAWIDSLTAIVVSFWIIKVALDIFFETNVELMDGIGDRKIYARVFDAVDAVEEADNPHKARIRKIGNMYAIVIDVEVDESRTVAEAHRISRQVEKEINRRVDNIYDITVHIEPAGHEESDESFGLDRSNID